MSLLSLASSRYRGLTTIWQFALTRMHRVKDDFEMKMRSREKFSSGEQQTLAPCASLQAGRPAGQPARCSDIAFVEI